MRRKQIVALLALTGIITTSFIKPVEAHSVVDVLKRVDNIITENTSTEVEPVIMYTSTRVNVRKRPTIKSDVVKTLDIAKKVKVLYTEGGWSKVASGWIKSRYLVEEKPTDKLLVTENERYWLYQLVEAEAGTESQECRAWITSVVFNLMTLNETPDNVVDVIFYKKLFSPTLDGRIYNVIPSKSTKKVVDKILKQGVVTDALYFEANYCHSKWHSQQQYIAQIDHTIFYK